MTGKDVIIESKTHRRKAAPELEAEFNSIKKKREANLQLSFPLNLYGCVGEFEKNTQRVRVSFFSGWGMLGKVCHLIKKNLLERVVRIFKAVMKAGGSFIDENKILHSSMIYIYIVIHRQICFVLSELISVARHTSFP